MYSRLAKTARELDHVVALRQPIADLRRLRGASRSWRPISTVIAHSLKANGGAIIARGRLRALMRAVDVFGFHLAPIDLRQNSDVHERTVAEILAAASPGLDYRAMSESERVALLRRELVSPRPLVSPFIAYSDETAGELACSAPRPRIRRDLWPRRDQNLDHLQDRQRLRHARARADPQGGRPRRGRTARPRSISCRCSRRSTTCAPASA